MVNVECLGRPGAFRHVRRPALAAIHRGYHYRAGGGAALSRSHTPEASTLKKVDRPLSQHSGHLSPAEYTPIATGSAGPASVGAPRDSRSATHPDAVVSAGATFVPDRS